MAAKPCAQLKICSSRGLLWKASGDMNAACLRNARYRSLSFCMLLSSAESSGTALRSSSVDAAADARARFLSADLCCADIQSSDAGELFCTAVTIAVRHSRITLNSSMAARINAVESPVFGGDAGTFALESEESVRIV